MLPFEIARPPSMPAWLCARCDGVEYGRLRALTFPQGVEGPSQIESFIDQNPDISRELTLWGQQGSRVLRGNLLVLPLDQSILYVEPVFLATESLTNRVPRLTRVILVNTGQAVMAPTFGEALSQLIRAVSPGSPELAAGSPAPAAGETGSPPPVSSTGRPASPSGSVAALVKQANQEFEAATEAQKRGDWAGYGTNLKRLQQTLRELNQRTGALR
jgi:uncharacterized membrane protein (UPF0182 family)